MPISKKIAITTLDDWGKYGHPVSPDQWADGRSAKEAARAWLASAPTNLPPEVSSALAKHPDFGPVLEWDAEPEVRLPFDTFGGNTRNTDVLVIAHDSHGPYLIAVEAKADEAFGRTVAETRAAAITRGAEPSHSNGVARINQLITALFSPQPNDDPPIEGLRYQLLTACAGAICEAERHAYSRALMLVHEFVTDKTTDKKHAQNLTDLNSFVRRLSHGAVPMVQNGEIYGPFTVPGALLLTPGKVELYIGKVSRNLRTGSEVIHPPGAASGSGTPLASGALASSEPVSGVPTSGVN